MDATWVLVPDLRNGDPLDEKACDVKWRIVQRLAEQTTIAIVVARTAAV